MEKDFCFENGEEGWGQFSDRSDTGAQSSCAALSGLKQTLLCAAQGRGTDDYLHAASKM